MEPAQAASVLPLITGHWVAQITRTHVALGVPDLLAEHGRTADDIALHAGSDPAATFRLLRAGVAVGLLTFDGASRTFAATPLLAALRSDVSGSLADMSLLWTEWSQWAPWGRLTEAVREGHNQVVATLGRTNWEYFAEHEAVADLFGRAVTEMSRPVITEAVAVIDVGAARTVVDVGGANGDFVLGLLHRHDDLRGIVFDQPTALSGARAAVGRAGLDGRCEVVGGDFFDRVPAGDIYLLKYILHDWDDESCVRILRSCRASMPAGARVLVVDNVVGDPSAPGVDAALMDINMLAMLSGRERDLPDFDRVFARAGLVRTALTPLSGAQHIIEARES